MACNDDYAAAAAAAEGYTTKGRNDEMGTRSCARMIRMYEHRATY